MTDSKTYIFGEQGNSSLNALLPFLQQRGIDPAYVAGLVNNNGGGFFGNNAWEGIIALIVVAAIFGNGNGGLFGNGNNYNSAEREMLMSAIQRNGTDLSQLAQSIGCSTSRLQDAIGEVSTQICNFAGQSGLSFQQVINSIQSGNAALASQLCSCCCDIKGAIKDVAIGQERGFSNVAYETQRQTCDLHNAIKDSTQTIVNGQKQAEMREMQNKIDALREENSTFKSSAMTSQIVGQAVAPINAVLAGLQQEVAGIKCKMPETATVPYQPFVAVPNCVAAQYGLYGVNGANGFWG